MPNIKTDLIKPSPYQPRIRFDLEDIKGSIQRDGILVGLTVRKKDGYFELVDGERRLRVAKGLNYKTVRCDVIDIDDDTARRMVWRVNVMRKDYEPKEKALFFKKMQEEHGMSIRGMEKEYETDRNTVKAYLNVFKLPEEYQQMVWAGELSIGVIRELDRLFNGVTYVTPKDTPEIFEIIDRAVSEKHFGFREAREAIKPHLARLREKEVREARKAVEKVVPKVKPPETAEEFEEAAKVLKREAKKRRTPGQVHREKVAEAKKSLKTTAEKINKAGEVIDVRGFRKRLDKIEETIGEDPAEAKDQLVALGKEVTEAKRRRQAELKEEARRKREEALRKELEEKAKKREEAIKIKLKMEAEEKAKTELLKDKKFLRAAAEKGKTIEELPEREEKPPVEIAPEELEEIQRRVREGSKRIAEILSKPEVKRRGKLFKNWLAHGAVIDVAGSLFCPHPKCGKSYKNLQWVSDKHKPIPVISAYEMAKEALDKEAKK